MSDPEAVRLHDSYWTTPEALGPEHCNDLHSLTVAVGWPHRPEDLAFLLGLDHSQGLIARDDIGRPIGSGMVFAYGPDRAMVSMMMTHPKLQAGGLGARLLDRLVRDAGTDRLRLNSTRDAERLYRSAGFTDVSTIGQYQGPVAPLEDAQTSDGANLRPATDADFHAITALDTAGFGAARPQLMRALWAVSEGVVLTQNGNITGFALVRLFGRGQVIGPMVAPDENSACTLVQHLLAQRAGAFVRMDTDLRYKALGRLLNASGMDTFSTVTAMTRGGATGPESFDGVYGLASHTLG